MKQTLFDYGMSIINSPIMCDNTSSINLPKNPIHHSRTKNIDIIHHFLRDHALNGDISLNFISTDNQVADIFTNPLKEDIFMRF